MRVAAVRRRNGRRASAGGEYVVRVELLTSTRWLQLWVGFPPGIELASAVGRMSNMWAILQIRKIRLL